MLDVVEEIHFVSLDEWTQKDRLQYLPKLKKNDPNIWPTNISLRY